jgi:hypothetical protein
MEQERLSFFRLGLIPQTVSPGRLQQANGLLSLTESGFAILGPVVAGVLVATVGSGCGPGH